MSEFDNNCESDDDSLYCNSIVVESISSELPSTSSDEDMVNWSQSITSSGSRRSSSVGPVLSVSDDDDSETTDIDKDDDDDTSSDTSDTSNPLGETEYEISEDEVIVLSDDDDDVIVLSDGNDVTDPNIDTAAHSQPPPTLDKPTSMVFQPSSKASVRAEEETATRSQPSSKASVRAEKETAARSQPSPTFNRPMSMLSTFSSTSSTCTDGEPVTASCNSESNGEENLSSSSIKNYLPPNLSTHKLCFDSGIEVDRILGAVVHNTQLLFRVRWRNDKNGGTDYVDAYEMHERCPHMALQFYNEYFKNKNTDKTDK